MKKLVCLIEDDSRLAKLIENRLSNLGFEVKHFLSGEEYLEHHDTGLMALYLVNEKLPGMRVIDVIKRIRLTSPLVPIMVITDDEEKDSIITLLKAGADDYHSHPINIEELTAKVVSRWEKYTVLKKRDFTWKEWG